MEKKPSPTAERLKQLAIRLEGDVYAGAVAIIQNAAYRVQELEDTVIKQNENLTDKNDEIEFLQYIIGELEPVLGPASDDVISMIREDYGKRSGKEIPDGY